MWIPILLPVLAAAPPHPPPKLMLWAWERAADLRAMPDGAGVAFLAATVTLRQGGVAVTPRFQPLRAREGAYRMAVIRIDSEGVAAGTHLRPAVDAIVEAARVTRVQAVQVDFDARLSQRAFYGALLRETRARLGRNTFLSMTALVSWCGRDSWLRGLPVDEIVPMTFDMGRASQAIETLLASGGTFEFAGCRESIGVADGTRAPGGFRRVYVFAMGAR